MAAFAGVELELFDFVNDLKRLPRTGWLLAGIAPVESIAEHSFATLFFALALTDDINSQLYTYNRSMPIDRERVLLLCIVHDLAESVLTDLPKRSSQLLGRKAKDAAERDAMEQLTGLMANGRDLLDLWTEYQESVTDEAKLAHDADKLEMVHQASRYESAGQRNLHEFWRGHEFHFAASEELYAALVARRGISAQC